MKRIIILSVVVLSFCQASLNAQNCEVLIIPFIQDRIDPLPEETRSFLETKLTQIITENGISAGDGYGQFYLVSRFALLNKDIVSGAPTMFSLRINVTLTLVDYFGEKSIASTNLELTGVGTNENRAYINAIRNLNPAHSRIQNFIKESKQKMLDYYDGNYNIIIQRALNLANQRRFEEALYHLTSIPECSKGYNAAMAAASDVYMGFINYNCQINLQQARLLWAASPNAQGAAQAGYFLAFIEPGTPCYADALVLYNEIRSSVKEDWKFEFRYYDPRSLTRERINAFREVGVAFGQGQQPSTTIIGRL